MTLQNCVRGSASSAWRANRGFLDFLTGEPGEARFQFLEARYDRLDDWTVDEKFVQDLSDDRRTSGFAYTETGPLKLAVNGADITIKRSPAVRIDHKRFALTVSSVLEIRANHAINLDSWLEQYVGPIANLLSLATSEPTSITSIEASYRGSKWVTVLLPSGATARSKTKLPAELLFSLADIRGREESTLRRWFELEERLHTVLALIFGPRRLERMYPEHRFLSSAQAAESYHRLTSDRTAMQPAEFSSLCKVLIEHTPPEHRDFLHGKLMHANEPNLGRRLKDLVERVGQQALPFLRNSRSKDRFIRKVTDTRNFYTHYDKSLNGEAARGEELFRLAQALEFMVTACLLMDLGFQDDYIGHKLNIDRRFRVMAEWFQGQK